MPGWVEDGTAGLAGGMTVSDSEQCRRRYGIIVCSPCFRHGAPRIRVLNGGRAGGRRQPAGWGGVRLVGLCAAGDYRGNGWGGGWGRQIRASRLSCAT